MIVFGVIYTVDIARGLQFKWYRPPGRIGGTCSHFNPDSPVWTITEDDPEEAREQFGPGARHRKYVGCVSKEVFVRFVREQGLDEQVMPTMGSIGAPTPDGDMALGIMPAVSFTGYGEGVWQNAYATPYVVRQDGQTLLRKSGVTVRDWDRLEAVIMGRRVRSSGQAA